MNEFDSVAGIELPPGVNEPKIYLAVIKGSRPPTTLVLCSAPSDLVGGQTTSLYLIQA